MPSDTTAAAQDLERSHPLVAQLERIGRENRSWSRHSIVLDADSCERISNVLIAAMAVSQNAKAPADGFGMTVDAGYINGLTAAVAKLKAVQQKGVRRGE